MSECLNFLFNGENGWGFAGINRERKIKKYEEAKEIYFNIIEEKPKVLGKIIFEQLESKNPGL